MTCRILFLFMLFEVVLYNVSIICIIQLMPAYKVNDSFSYSFLYLILLRSKRNIPELEKSCSNRCISKRCKWTSFLAWEYIQSKNKILNMQFCCWKHFQLWVQPSAGVIIVCVWCNRVIYAYVQYQEMKEDISVRVVPKQNKRLCIRYVCYCTLSSPCKAVYSATELEKKNC